MRLLPSVLCAMGLFLGAFGAVAMAADPSHIKQESLIFGLGVALTLIGLAIERKSR